MAVTAYVTGANWAGAVKNIEIEAGTEISYTAEIIYVLDQTGQTVAVFSLANVRGVVLK